MLKFPVSNISVLVFPNDDSPKWCAGGNYLLAFLLEILFLLFLCGFPLLGELEMDVLFL